MSTALKHALVDHHDPAYRVAIKLNRSDGWLSKVAAGIKEPTELEKQELSKILGKSIVELFPAHTQLELDLILNKNSISTQETSNGKK